MKTIQHTFRVFAALVSCIFAFAGKSDVLLWTVSENATVDGTTDLYTFMSPIPDDDLHNPAGRVKVSGGSLSEPIYLDNWVQDLETNPYYLDEGGGYFGVWIGDSGSGHYSIMYQQSQFPSELGTEVLFSIELGRMDWDDDTWMSGIFTVLAESDQYTYEQVKQHMYPTFDLNPPVADWMPLNFHTIPEPSSGLLLLLGLAPLLLARKSI